MRPHATLVLLPLLPIYGPVGAQPGVKGQVLCPFRSSSPVEVKMVWSAPKILEISCGMEINRYAPADDTDPVQF
jgi:coenzyme PQQ precursor peptide PqqA